MFLSLARSVTALAVLSAAALLLAGCVPTPAPDPMSDQLRSAIAQQRADRAWTAVAIEYPEALRPVIIPGPPVDDADWPAAEEKCFEGEGFSVAQRGQNLQFSSSQGQSPLQFAVATYHCTLAVPKVSEIAVQLDRFQLGDLYDYYTRIVQPCLQLAGQPTSTPPSRKLFTVEHFAFLWHPYAEVWAKPPGAKSLAALERQCPPVPGWLHL